MNAIQTIFKTRNEKAIALIDDWIADDSGYDERVWPQLKESIETNRLSERNRFNDNTGDTQFLATRVEKSDDENPRK